MAIEKETQRKIDEAEAQAKAEAEKKAQEEKNMQKEAENEGKTMSVLSLIMGIVAMVSLGALLVPEILGIVFAIKGKKQGQMRGAAKAGLVLSVLSIVVVVAAIIIGFNIWLYVEELL